MTLQDEYNEVVHKNIDLSRGNDSLNAEVTLLEAEILSKGKWIDETQDERDAARAKVELLTAEVSGLKEIVNESLAGFRCTQRESDYPEDHWSNRAVSVLGSTETYICTKCGRTKNYCVCPNFLNPQCTSEVSGISEDSTAPRIQTNSGVAPSPGGMRSAPLKPSASDSGSQDHTCSECEKKCDSSHLPLCKSCYRKQCGYSTDSSRERSLKDKQALINKAKALGWKWTPIELVDAGQAWGYESPDQKTFLTVAELIEEMAAADSSRTEKDAICLDSGCPMDGDEHAPGCDKYRADSRHKP